VLGAIDPATGATLWEVPADLDRRFTPLALPDRILFPGSTYVAYAIADGRELSRTAGVCCTAIASPDGAHVYLRTGVDEAGELLGDGRIGRRFRGEVAAVSGRFVAVLSRPGASTLAVYAHGGARPLWSVTGKDEHDDFSAVGISGDRVLFFRSGDDGVWMHDLATGRDRALLTIHAKIVLSPDRRGSAPANMTTPPVLAPPLLFVHDWTIRAYRVEE
jgi:hypothetical protein